MEFLIVIPIAICVGLTINRARGAAREAER